MGLFDKVRLLRRGIAFCKGVNIMPFVMPMALMRKNLIIKKLRARGAVSEEYAKSLAEAGVINRISGGRYYV